MRKFVSELHERKVKKMRWLIEPIGERKIREEKMDASHFVVRQPKFYIFLGLHSIFVSSIMLVLLWMVRQRRILEETGLEGLLLFVAIVCIIGGAYFLIRWSTWKVEVNDSRIIIRTLFGGTESFTFDEIEKVVAKKVSVPEGNVNLLSKTPPRFISRFNQISIRWEEGKPFKVYAAYEGFFLLVSRLEQEQVPFEVSEMVEEEKVEKVDKNHFAVHQPKSTVVVGVVCLIFFVGFIIFATIMSTEYDSPLWELYLFFGLFILLCVYLILYGINWRVEVIGDEIHYRSMFGATKVFTFSEVKEVKNKMVFQQAVLYSEDGKLLAVSWNSKGCRSFLALLEEKGVAVDRVIGS